MPVLVVDHANRLAVAVLFHSAVVEGAGVEVHILSSNCIICVFAVFIHYLIRCINVFIAYEALVLSRMTVLIMSAHVS